MLRSKVQEAERQNPNLREQARLNIRLYRMQHKQTGRHPKVEVMLAAMVFLLLGLRLPDHVEHLRSALPPTKSIDASKDAKVAENYVQWLEQQASIAHLNSKGSTRFNSEGSSPRILSAVQPRAVPAKSKVVSVQSLSGNRIQPVVLPATPDELELETSKSKETRQRQCRRLLLEAYSRVNDDHGHKRQRDKEYQRLLENETEEEKRRRLENQARRKRQLRENGTPTLRKCPVCLVYRKVLPSGRLCA